MGKILAGEPELDKNGVKEWSCRGGGSFVGKTTVDNLAKDGIKKLLPKKYDD